MDTQYRGKNHSSGHEGHVVHLCHKCGWPFPNPHPSAKHRRAHKKICGTIQGYKLLHSGDISHTTASDDEPLSDDDHKTPIAQVPKVMESCILEKNIGGTGAISNRSEDFQDSRFGLVRQDSLDNASKADKIADKDLIANNSFKDCKDSGILQPPRNSADGVQKENLVPKRMCILSMVTAEHQDLGLSCSKYSDNRNGSASDMVPFKTAVAGVSEESRKFTPGDRVTNFSVALENDADRNEEGTLTKYISGGLISEHAGRISEAMSMSEKGLDVTVDMVFTDNMVQLKEEFSARLASKTSMSENGEQETDGDGNQGINLERTLMDIVASNSEHACAESGLAEKTVELEENSSKFPPNMVIDDLSAKAKSAKDMVPSTDTFQIQTDAAQGKDSASALISNEVNDKKKKEKENVSVYVFSVPNDIPVVDDSEIKLERFNEQKEVKLPLLEALDSEEIIVDKDDEVMDRVSQEKFDTFQSNQLDDDIKFGTSHMLVAEKSDKLGGNNEGMVKEVVVEGETDLLHLNKRSDALVPIVDVDTTENEKDQKVCSVEEQQPVYVSDELLETGFLGCITNVLPDVNPMIAYADIENRKLDNEVGSDDAGFPERARTGVFDISGGDNMRRIDDENYVKNTAASPSCESTYNFSLSQTNPASNLLEVDNSDYVGPRKTENYDINFVEGGDGVEVGYFSMQTDSTSESISSHHQSSIIGEEVSNEYVRTIRQTEGPKFNRVSNSQDHRKKSEVNRDNKVQGEYAAEDLMASVLDNSGGHEFERTSDDQLKQELMHSSSHAEPTGQITSAVDGSHTREDGVDASGISATVLQGEASNGSVKPHLDTPVVDVSIESSSQTTSSEGHWGSVSVLSTQSDNAAAMNTETLPPTGSLAVSEAEKAKEKYSNVASEEQHFDKLGEFEPPSFMKLVEPVGGDEKDAAATTKIQTVQNAQEPRAATLQAGWFPSPTHGADESQGRKNNEEIIAKVTDLNAKQYTLSMNLLGEPNTETRPKSPNSKENPAAVKEKVAEDNGAMVTKVSSIMGPESPVAEPNNIEAGKEWDSPARYPAEIKREKRKVKGRPLWVQFVCCSSVN